MTLFCFLLACSPRIEKSNALTKSIPLNETDEKLLSIISELNKSSTHALQDAAKQGDFSSTRGLDFKYANNKNLLRSLETEIEKRIQRWETKSNDPLPLEKAKRALTIQGLDGRALPRKPSSTNADPVIEKDASGWKWSRDPDLLCMSSIASQLRGDPYQPGPNFKVPNLGDIGLFGNQLEAMVWGLFALAGCRETDFASVGEFAQQLRDECAHFAPHSFFLLEGRIAGQTPDELFVRGRPLPLYRIQTPWDLTFADDSWRTPLGYLRHDFSHAKGQQDKDLRWLVQPKSRGGIFSYRQDGLIAPMDGVADFIEARKRDPWWEWWRKESTLSWNGKRHEIISPLEYAKLLRYRLTRFLEALGKEQEQKPEDSIRTFVDYFHTNGVAVYVDRVPGNACTTLSNEDENWTHWKGSIPDTWDPEVWPEYAEKISTPKEQDLLLTDLVIVELAPKEPLGLSLRFSNGEKVVDHPLPNSAPTIELPTER